MQRRELKQFFAIANSLILETLFIYWIAYSFSFRFFQLNLRNFNLRGTGIEQG